jgi:hypothetical protein
MKKLAFLIAFFLIASFTFAQNTKPAAPAKKPKAEWKKTTHDFGKIPQNVPVTTTFVVKNVGKLPLIISAVSPSCGCTTPSYTKDPIMPGKTGEIKAQYNAAATGSFSKTLSVTTNEPENSTIILTIKGEVAGGAGQ